MQNSSQFLGYFLTTVWSIVNVVTWVGVAVLIVLFAKKRLVFVSKKDAEAKSKE